MLSQRPASRCISAGAVLSDRVGSPPLGHGNNGLAVPPVYLAALRAGREGPRICMRPAAREPRGRGLAGEGRRQGSPLPREPPLLRRRSLLPPPPPSRSLVLAGAAQTCSGAAAPAWSCLWLRPREPATEAGGALLAVPGPSVVPGKGACPGRESSRGQRGARSLRCALAASRAGSVLPRSALPSHTSPFASRFFFTLPPLCPFSLPLVLSLLTSSAFFFLYLSSLFPFPLSFPLPLPSSPRSLLLSCFPTPPFPSFSPLRPACLSGPLLPSGFFSLGSKTACQVCVCFGEGGGAQLPDHGPLQEEGEKWEGSSLSSSFPAAPPYLYSFW